MVLHGTIRNGTVVLEEKIDLPEGKRVRLDLSEADEPDAAPTIWQKLLELSGTVKDGPPDASRNHDHYLYGAPKREPEE